MKLALLLLSSLAAFGAFPNGYDNRVAITINASQVTGTLTAFTWPVDGTYADLKHTGSGGYVTNSSGYDIVYTESDGTTAIPYCREIWTSGTGRVVDHVKPASTANGTVIYQYFGKSSVSTDQSDCANTWRSTFTHFWPLLNGTTLSGVDLIGGQTMTGVNTPTAGTGQVDGAGVFVTASSQSMRTSAFTLSTVPMVLTFSAWVKITNMTIRNNIFTTAVDGTAQMWWMEIGSSGTCTNCMVIAVPGIFVFYSGSYPTDAAWHHVAFSRNGTGNTAALYVDGVSKSITYSASDFVDSASKIRALAERASTQYLGGSLDMVTYADTVRTGAEIAAEFKSGTASTFYSVGSRETLASRRRITVVN